MPRQVVPENVDEEMQNQVNVIWLERKDTQFGKNTLLPLHFSKRAWHQQTLGLFENSNEREERNTKGRRGKDHAHFKWLLVPVGKVIFYLPKEGTFLVKNQVLSQKEYLLKNLVYN